MSTPNPASLGDRRFCDVCDERIARWRVAAPAAEFVACTACRDGEPCRRCGIERDNCRCAAGPDIVAWLPLTGEG
jgi:hypothetical protein